MVYTGKEVKHAVTDIFVERSNYDQDEYAEGVDYEVEYANNTEAGTATVTVSGIGKYGGSVSEEFTIQKTSNTMKASGKTVKLKAASVKKKARTIKASKAFKADSAIGKVTYTKTNGSKNFTVSPSGKITVKKGTKKGSYVLTVKVKAAGDKNHKPASKAVKVKFIIK